MIATLAQHYQRDAVRVTTLTDRTQHADIAYQVLEVAQADAENAIINVLRYHEAQNALVFANTRATVNRLAARFANRGFSVVSLSGELSQTERTHALQAMRDGRARVCVATDVAARGIDLPNLELVVHAELPTNAETLLHRSGRTGRAGRKGLSALVVPPKAARHVERLLKSARVVAEWTRAPSADEIRRRDEERLLADPAWSDELAEDEASFADRLLALHGPRAIAAACLRFYRAQHSAPEELADPAARPAARERAPFGPSVWFILSVGREARAEARWLLPMLCRAGRLGKDAIGAIRVQQSETFVEIAEASVPGFLAAIGPDGTLEDGITARRADGPPEEARAPAKTAQRRDARPAGSSAATSETAPAAPHALIASMPRPAQAPDDKRQRSSGTLRPRSTAGGSEDAGRTAHPASPHRRAEDGPRQKQGRSKGAAAGVKRPGKAGSEKEIPHTVKKTRSTSASAGRSAASDTSRRYDPSDRPSSGPGPGKRAGGKRKAKATQAPRPRKNDK
jgi:ATP-dependent RNA helicase DeaD